MKTEKGITLITLIITIIVMLILLSVAITTGVHSIEQAKGTAVISELEMIQAKVDTIFEKRKLSQLDKQYYDSLGKELSVIESERVEAALQGKSQQGFRYFSQEDLKSLELDNITQEVLIQYDTKTVISLNGIQIDGIRYYQLQDLPNYSGYQVEQGEEIQGEPNFQVETTKLQDAWRVNLIKIQYQGKANTGTVAYRYGTQGNWVLLGQQTSFTVNQSGLYEIRLTDTNGNNKIVKTYVNEDYTQKGLIGYYDAQNNTGNGHQRNVATWKDLSGQEKDATIIGLENQEEGVGWTQDSFRIDGIDDKITFPVSYDVSQDMTIEIVFEEHNYEKIGILASDCGWKAFHSHTYNKNGDIYIGGNYEASGGNLNRFIPTEIGYQAKIGKIQTLTYQYDANTKQAAVWINGEKKASKVFQNAPNAISYFAIGNSSEKEYYRFSFYNQVLTQEEIKKNFEIDQYRFDIR